MKIGDTVRLKKTVEIDEVPGHEYNSTAIVVRKYEDGCVALNRDLGYRQYWNVNDLVVVKEKVQQ